jgi:hypothetical protein
MMHRHDGALYAALAALGTSRRRRSCSGRAGRDRRALAALTGFGAGFLLAVVLVGMLPHAAALRAPAASSPCWSATSSCT